MGTILSPASACEVWLSDVVSAVACFAVRGCIVVRIVKNLRIAHQSRVVYAGISMPSPQGIFPSFLFFENHYSRPTYLGYDERRTYK